MWATSGGIVWAGGVAVLAFDATTHTYTHNGVVVPSVTQVLALVQDRRWFTEESAWRGSAVHAACELDDEGDLDEGTVLEEHRGYLDAWRSFKFAAAPRFTAIEERFYSPLGYAGTRDRRAIINGAQCVLDLKTGDPGRVCALQLAAYATFGERRFAVRLKPNGRYTATEYAMADCRRDMQRFLACLQVVNLRAEFGIN